MPKRGLGINVLEAARQRIEWTFDNFDTQTRAGAALYFISAGSSGSSMPTRSESAVISIIGFLCFLLVDSHNSQCGINGIYYVDWCFPTCMPFDLIRR